MRDLYIWVHFYRLSLFVGPPEIFYYSINNNICKTRGKFSKRLEYVGVANISPPLTPTPVLNLGKEASLVLHEYNIILSGSY